MSAAAVSASNAVSGAKYFCPSSPTATVLTCRMDAVRDPGAMLALTTVPSARATTPRQFCSVFANA